MGRARRDAEGDGAVQGRHGDACAEGCFGERDRKADRDVVAVEGEVRMRRDADHRDDVGRAVVGDGHSQAGVGFDPGRHTNGDVAADGQNADDLCVRVRIDSYDGTTLQRTRPVPVTAGLGWAAVSSGTQHTCGVMAGGTAYCWGLNDHGQLGDGTTTQRTNPMLVAGGLRFIEVSAGASHTCGVTAAGTYCWGANASGQLGDGTTSDRSVPAKVAGQP